MAPAPTPQGGELRAAGKEQMKSEVGVLTDTGTLCVHGSV